jgi:osmotically-inducible protein OsmY
MALASMSCAMALCNGCSRSRRPAAGKTAEMGSARFAGTPEAQWPDDEVTRGVRDVLAVQLGATAAAAVAVEVKNGVVVLSGTTATPLEKQAAPVAAASVRGVRSVVNEIRVIPSPRSHSAIADDVHASLHALPFGDRAAVTIRDRIVSLRGTLESLQQERAAAHAAAGVVGVVDVRDETRVDPPSNRPDVAIQRDVQSRLRGSCP